MNGFSFNGLVTKTNGDVLLVSSSKETIAGIEKNIAQTGASTLVAKTQQQVFGFLEEEQVCYILIDTELSDIVSEKFIRALKARIGERYTPIIMLASIEDKETLSQYRAAGCDDILFKPFSLLEINAHIASLEKIRELKKLYKGSIDEQMVAKQILASAIAERSLRFDGIGFISRAKAIFSGDLFLTARRPDGSLNILLADFTGHGLPASIGALPVADAFSVMTKKGFELSYILENINSKLHTLLPTSMFMACSALSISRNLRQVKIWNGGMPDIYIREGSTGGLKYKIRSSQIPLGIAETILNRYELQDVELTPGDQIILFTDGLTESLNKDNDMFGEHRLEQCLQKNSEDESIFAAVINTFDEFCGEVIPMDDVTLACIPCSEKIMHENDFHVSDDVQVDYQADSHWRWYMELGGSSLHGINPVPIAIDEIHKIAGQSNSAEKLSNIMSVLYKNAIEYSAVEEELNDSDLQQANRRYIGNSNAYIRIGIREVDHNEFPALLVHIEGSGKEIDIDELQTSLCNEVEIASVSNDEGFPLVYELDKSSYNKGLGNRLEAIICTRV